MKKIVFTGGGTLGHVMPNLYLMDELKDWQVFYIGSNGIEKDKLKNKVWLSSPTMHGEEIKYITDLVCKSIENELPE